MIYSLRRKFILISTISVFSVLIVIFAVMYVMNHMQLNHTMDTLADAIVSNDGVFPRHDKGGRPFPSGGAPHMDIITKETPFSTRFFTVWLGADHQIVKVNVESVFSITEAESQEYVDHALGKKCERGWVSDYRFCVFQSGNQTAIVFVNGEMNRMMSNRFLLTALLTLVGSGMAVLLLIISISKRAVYPAAESYEKQRQFITDANHELKTPLTLILSDLDIVESEVGKNEWLDDMRSEGERMRTLINQLVTLSRMDEDQANLSIAPFDLSGAVLDTVSEFQSLAEERKKHLTAKAEPSVEYCGDEGLIRRLLTILLDNAVKYCDEGGSIEVMLYRKRRPVIKVENTYGNVDSLKLDRLFDRFYRGDKSRSFDGSFGVGLSIARAIAKNHHGDIAAYKKEQTIGFKVELK
ncbi:sensor kinase CusS [Lachnospiraceae bacterium]|jgi:two-component system sensor histidine kinase CiaH|uniref:sensor histidine kinase n=1 Tax=Candidatus Merdisoma sp. JLR.KK011 TaxID=3114299 RepID=UPI001433B986|nr:HAMP domain-containing histidine kinase [Lachnospiraceae bacterium]GFI09115.1 sensor kinase CusS [Lachnospiraceae bacterium]